MVSAIFPLALLAAPPLAATDADQPSTTDAEIAALKAKVETLEKALADVKAQLDATDKRRAATPAAGTTASPTDKRPATGSSLAAAEPPPQIATSSVPTSRLPNRNTIGDELTGVARPDTAPPPNDPKLKGFMTIPGTDTMIRIGGFAKVNAIYDFSPAGNADKLVPGTIPVGGEHGRNANVDANATRFSFEVRRPSSLGPLRFYLENDFYGGSGTTAFRLRQAHGQVGNLYGGYGYSAFMDSDAFPETLDDEGPPGEAFIRLAALRKIWKLKPGLTATMSIEDPSSDISLPTDAVADQPMPDLVGAMRLERDWGHVQAAVVARSLGYRLNGGDESKFAYGLSLSGLGKIGGDFVMASFTYGDGIARYFNDLGGRGYDAVIDEEGRIRPLVAYGGYVGLTHHWSDRWRSNLTGSMVVIERDDRLVATAYRSSSYGAANLIFQASPSFTVGVETLYGRHELQNGQSADVVRLQTSIKYDFVR